MRIAVLIKQVPDSDDIRMDETTGTLIRDGAATVPNLPDLHALAAARDLCPASGDTAEPHVTAFSMGPPSAERTLREALAAGAHEAILVTDPLFAGSDTWATARVLARAIEKRGPFDLILCGEKATDGETGQVGPQIAVLLNLPFATRATAVRAAPGGIEITRELENGHQKLRLPLPCLITVTTACSLPDLPTLAAHKAARRAQLPRLSAADLGFAAEDTGLKGSPTRVMRIFRPRYERNTRLFRREDLSSGLDAIRETLQSEPHHQDGNAP